jgi:pyroglutamyl-peptidase
MPAFGDAAHPGLAPVLLTGFNAFGGADRNPSWLAVQALEGEFILGRQVLARQLPCEFAASLTVLRSLVKTLRPALVICTGVAGGRAAMSVERVAVNLCDARIPDNAGMQPVDAQVVTAGPAAYFSSLPIKAIVHAMQGEGIAAEVSYTAGTFVCNHVFYALMHRLARQRGASPQTRGGFIHLPWMEGQGEPCMPLERMVEALRVAVRTSLAVDKDLQVSAGQIS